MYKYTVWMTYRKQITFHINLKTNYMIHNCSLL